MVAVRNLAMTKRAQEDEIKRNFYQINRLLTLGLVGLIILISVFFWYTGYAAVEDTSLWIGLALMVMAVIFYHRQERPCLPLLGSLRQPQDLGQQVH